MSHRVLPLTHRILLLIQAIALFILVLYGLMFVQHAAAAVRFPYQLDYGEGLELYQVFRLLNGQPLYSDIHQPPYHVGVYAPLYPVVIAPIAALTGIGYGAGRAVSAILTLVIAWLLGQMVYSETRTLWTGVVTGLLWLASHFVYSWAAFMRVDMLSIALSLLGLHFFWSGYIRQGRERYVLVAMVLFVAAAYARQTSVWAAAACLVYLALTRRWALMGKALAVYAGLGLAILCLLQATTGGEIFRQLFLYNNNHAWNFRRWQVTVSRAWAMYPLAILAGPITLVLALLRRWPALPALYLGFAWLSSITISGAGGYINHLLEADAAMCLACGLLLGWMGKSRRPLWPLVASVALLIQVALVIHLPYSLQGGVLPPWTAVKNLVRQPAKQNRAAYSWTPADADIQVAGALDERVRQTPGLILSEDGSFTTTHGRPLWIQFSDFTLFAYDSVWDQTPFLNQIRDRQFALILLKFNIEGAAPRSILTPEMVDAIRSSYILDNQMWLYYVYVPRSAPAN